MRPDEPDEPNEIEKRLGPLVGHQNDVKLPSNQGDPL